MKWLKDGVTEGKRKVWLRCREYEEVVPMQTIEFHTQVERLTSTTQAKRVEVQYVEQIYTLPGSSKKPPYYADPKYQTSYPTL